MKKLFEVLGSILGGILVLIPVILVIYFVLNFAHFDWIYLKTPRRFPPL